MPIVKPINSNWRKLLVVQCWNKLFYIKRGSPAFVKFVFRFRFLGHILNNELCRWDDDFDNEREINAIYLFIRTNLLSRWFCQNVSCGLHCCCSLYHYCQCLCDAAWLVENVCFGHQAWTNWIRATISVYKCLLAIVDASASQQCCY